MDIGGYVIKREDNRLITDRTAVFPNFEGAHLKSEVLVDRNLIEIFVNDGEYVVSSAVYGLKDRFIHRIQSNVELYTSEA